MSYTDLVNLEEEVLHESLSMQAKADDSSVLNASGCSCKDAEAVEYTEEEIAEACSAEELSAY